MKSFILQAMVIPSEEGWFMAEIPSLPACIAYGRTRDEALTNVKEAARTYISTLGGGEYGLPTECLVSEVEVSI